MYTIQAIRQTTQPDMLFTFLKFIVYDFLGVTNIEKPMCKCADGQMGKCEIQ
jgi:hypothetical protein